MDFLPPGEGEGIAAGGGKTAGRGTKGQNARSGGGVRPYFEGGQRHPRAGRLGEREAHELEWVRAAKAGKPAVSSFDYAAHLTEICLLGNLAKRMDARLDWDGPNMKVTNNEAANEFVKPKFRKGWELKEITG